MARLVTRSGRSRLPALLGAVLLATAVLALGAFYLFPRPTGPTQNSPAESGSNPPTATQPAADAAPTGCLGGQQRDAAMVLAAQQQASHSAYGAVEVAAAVFRWGLRYPYPSQAELGEVRALLDPATATKQEADWDRQYRTAGYSPPPGIEAADGTPYYVTTANGSWLVSGDSTADSIDVQLETHPVVDDAYSTSTVTLEVDLRWLNGAWRVHNLARADAQALANGGTTFTSGC